MRALCATRPAQWWDVGDDGNRLALALCRVCPALEGCGARIRQPAGVVLAGVAYGDAGLRLPICHCGYPNELDGGCCHRCGVTTLPGVPRRIYWQARYRRQRDEIREAA